MWGFSRKKSDGGAGAAAGWGLIAKEEQRWTQAHWTDRPSRTQLLIYSLAAGVCGQRALEGRPVGQICPGTLEQLQGGFDSTLKLLLALLGGAALTRMDR
jgi:hypothetical protein